jgi:hypothetical protein
MRMLHPALIITLAALWSCNVHASPDNASNGLDKSPADTGLLIEQAPADKGLLTQMNQVRQSMQLKASELVVDAMGFVGVPYQSGGSTVETGFDCSGFVRAVYEQSIGLLLPRKAEEQAFATQKIDKHDLKPGDLVFFNTMRRAFSHVGIYVGEGKFIHSPRPGGEVRLESMALSYWQHRFDGARRVPAVASEQAGATTPFVLTTLASNTAAKILKQPLISKQPQAKKRTAASRSQKTASRSKKRARG